MAGGQQINSAQGSVVAEGGDGSIALTGHAATSAAGSTGRGHFIPLRSRKLASGSASRALTGSSAAFGTGTLVHAESFALVGSVGTLAQGTLLYRGQVTLNWNANTEPDLAGYRVYHGTSPGVYIGADTVTLGLVTTYVYGGLLPGMTHYFAITAFDTSNNESVKSLEVSKTF